jgi:hypothetical protein
VEKTKNGVFRAISSTAGEQSAIESPQDALLVVCSEEVPQQGKGSGGGRAASSLGRAAAA